MQNDLSKLSNEDLIKLRDAGGDFSQLSNEDLLRIRGVMSGKKPKAEPKGFFDEVIGHADTVAETTYAKWLYNKANDGFYGLASAVEGDVDPAYENLEGFRGQGLVDDELKKTMQGVNRGKLTTITDEGYAGIIKSQLADRLLDVKTDQHGQEIITYRGSDGQPVTTYINKPGLDSQDVDRFVGSAIPFMAGAGVTGGLLKGAGLFGRMIGQGATALGVDASMQKIAQDQGSGEDYSLSRSLLAGLGGAGGEALGTILTKVTQAGYIDKATGKLNAAGREWARSNKLNPEDVSEALAQHIGRNINKAADPEELAISARAGEFGIDTTKSQRTKSPTDAFNELQMEKGLMGRDAEAAMRNFKKNQGEQIEEAAFNDVGGRLAPEAPGMDRADLGQTIKSGLDDTFNEAKKIENKAWSEIGPIYPRPEAFDSLPDIISKRADMAGMRLLPKGTEASAEMTNVMQQFMAGDLKSSGMGILKSRANDSPASPYDPMIMYSLKDGKIKTESKAFKNWSNNRPLVKSREARDYEFKTGEGVTVQAFHGSNKPDLKILDPDAKGSDWTKGTGVWASSTDDVASSYVITGQQGRVYELFMTFENPKVIDGRGGGWDEIFDGDIWQILRRDGPGDYKEVADFTSKEKAQLYIKSKPDQDLTLGYKEKTTDTNTLARKAREDGHDGIIVKNVSDGGDHQYRSNLPSTVYVAFDSTKLKPAIGNSGKLDTKKTNIDTDALDIDEARRILLATKNTAKPGSPDARLANHLYEGFNEWIDDAAEKSALISDDPAAYAKLKSARSVTREINQAIFPVNKEKKLTPAAKKIKQLLDHNDSPEAIVSELFGRGQTVTELPKHSYETTGRLIALLKSSAQGDAAPEAVKESANKALSSIKMAYWVKLVQDKNGKVLSANKINKNIDNAFNLHRSIIGQMFDKKERDLIKRFSQAMKDLHVEHPNPSLSAVGVGHLAKKLGKQGFLAQSKRELFSKHNVLMSRIYAMIAMKIDTPVFSPGRALSRRATGQRLTTRSKNAYPARVDGVSSRIGAGQDTD